MEVLLYTCLHSCTLFFLSVASSTASSCSLRRRFNLNEMHKKGDVVLGGLFEVHYTSLFPDITYTSEPEQPICEG